MTLLSGTTFSHAVIKLVSMIILEEGQPQYHVAHHCIPSCVSFKFNPHAHHVSGHKTKLPAGLAYTMHYYSVNWQSCIRDGVKIDLLILKNMTLWENSVWRVLECDFCCFQLLKGNDTLQIRWWNLFVGSRCDATPCLRSASAKICVYLWVCLFKGG